MKKKKRILTINLHKKMIVLQKKNIKTNQNAAHRYNTLHNVMKRYKPTKVIKKSKIKWPLRSVQIW